MEKSFENYHLQPYLMKAIESLNFYEPTEIQHKVISNIQVKRDIIAQAKTGSGKTHAFLLPLINQIKKNTKNVQIVITAPSRELAEQLYQDSVELVKHAPYEIEIGRFIGGTEKSRQIESLKANQPDIAIGTPGRLKDLIQSNHLKTYEAFAMVVDEADMTLDMGFIEDIDQIASTLPKDGQFLIFSATIPQKLRPFLNKYLNNPLMIEIENKNIISDLVDNWLISTKSKNKMDILYELTTIGNPYLVLIFANTQEYVEVIANQLQNKGLNVGILHGGLTSRERRRTMREIHRLEYQYVVATDLAARGIDIEGVSHVINAETPQDLSYFVHRVGRTGRNNLPGIAITLYSPDEESDIEILENMGIKFSEKIIKNKEIINAPIRRKNRKKPKKRLEYDAEIEGMAHKAKKKIKPGYRRKIKQKRKKKQRKNKRKFR